MSPLASEDTDAGALVLASAFRDNPLNVAVIGADPERRLSCNRAGMRQLLPVARRHGVVLGEAANGHLAGVLIATPPYVYPLPAPGLSSQLRTLWVQGIAVRSRWARVFAQLDHIHPEDPCWYLATLGVAPAAQGLGVGRALLRELLERADRDGLPCYLETDRSANLPFYEASGFAVERESRVLSVPVWHMRRAAA